MFKHLKRAVNGNSGRWIVGALAGLVFVTAGCETAPKGPKPNRDMVKYELSYTADVQSLLQLKLEAIDSRLRVRLGMTTNDTAAGVLDLNGLTLGLLRPDRIEYAASVPKIGILLAYFQLHPEAAKMLDPQIKHELGLMAKASDNEMATKFSKEMGLKPIQEVLNTYKFYDPKMGGGIWVGKHYGKDDERYPDPVGGNSHAATVRQIMRFFLMLEQQKLVSKQASVTMREIFESPEIPHDDIKFVKGLQGRGVEIIRKWGTWEDWRHDAAVVKGAGRHYIIVGMTKHPRGDEYLEQLVAQIDDIMIGTH